jgi:hypothetical protein
MQLVRARLSPAESLRKLNTQSCLYCGATEHFLATCPLKTQAHQVDTSTLMSHTGSFPSLIAHTPLHATLFWGERSKSLRLLIDSGANEGFMDATLVLELGIPTHTISTPMDVKALDGQSTGSHKHYISH